MTGQRCAFGEHCESGTPAVYLGELCGQCRLNTVRDIRALVYDFVDLCQLIPRMRHLPTDAISRPKPGPTVPIDTEILTLCDDIRLLLLHWERGIAHRHRQATPPPRRAIRDGHAVQRAAEYLAAHVDEIAVKFPASRSSNETPSCWDTGVHALLRLRDLHRVARARVGRDAHRIALPGECPDRICRAPTLTRMEGGGTVTCRACGNTWAYEDYQKYVTLRVTTIDKLTDDEPKTQPSPEGVPRVTPS